MSNMDFVEIDGKVIYYNINSEFMHCKYDKNGQLVKAQRMILIIPLTEGYREKGKVCKSNFDL